MEQTCLSVVSTKSSSFEHFLLLLRFVAQFFSSLLLRLHWYRFHLHMYVCLSDDAVRYLESKSPSTNAWIMHVLYYGTTHRVSHQSNGICQLWAQRSIIIVIIAQSTHTQYEQRLIQPSHSSRSVIRERAEIIIIFLPLHTVYDIFMCVINKEKKWKK